MKYLFVACLLCLSVLSAVAKVPAMNKIRLTNNWEYLKGDLGGGSGRLYVLPHPAVRRRFPSGSLLRYLIVLMPKMLLIRT